MANTKFITPVTNTTPQPITVETDGHSASGIIENLHNTRLINKTVAHVSDRAYSIKCVNPREDS